LKPDALLVSSEDGAVKLELRAGKAILHGAAIELGEGSTKGVARAGDSITIPIGGITFGTAGSTNPAPISGTITGSSATVTAKD
jgi:hypothetical protein